MKITAKLSAKSLRKAAAELRAYKSRVEQLPEKLVAELASQGAQIALFEARDIKDTGYLLSRIMGESGGKIGYVKCKCGYAVFVEFGTGVVGSNKPHPDISILGWQYDVNGHGELGWWYPGKDGKLHWTRGMSSRPFMFNTAQQLRRLVIPTAKMLL